jgi:hypothetical protein
MKGREKINILKNCFEETIWMAVRYAHGRHTYAPDMVREAVNNFKKVFPDFKLEKDTTLNEPKENLSGIEFKSDYLNDLFI